MRKKDDLFALILELFHRLRHEKKDNFNRVLPFGDYFVDRWEKARDLGFGEGTSVYDNVVILGKVKVGCNTWIGPNVILDGSGGLEIGSFCSISAGVQIYSHDSVQWAVSGGQAKYEYAPVIINDNCYIGPNVIISKGVELGKCAIVGANSFVNESFPTGSKIAGNPARLIT